MGTVQNNIKLNKLMYTLFYPAVLGAMIMYVLNEINNNVLVIGSYPFLFAVFLAFYFSVQHLQNVDIHEGYNLLLFLFDICEITYMFFIFSFLYLSNSSIESDRNAFYILLAINFLIPVLSRFCTKDIDEICNDTNQITMSILSTLAALISASILIFGSVLDGIGLLFLYVLFVYYLFVIVFSFRIKKIFIEIKAVITKIYEFRIPLRLKKRN